MIMKKFIDKYLVQIQIVIVVLLLAIIGASGYFIYFLSRQIISIQNSVALEKADNNSKFVAINEEIKGLVANLEIVAKTNQELSQNLQAQQSQSNSLGQTLSGLAGTVNTLEKLSKTDRELLQKYSKVYFLNENYVPVQLSNIDQKYLQNKDANLQFHTIVMPYFTKMLDDAASNVSAVIQVVSAYRSFGTQSALKSSYRTTYGIGANSFSADQGYSEHQLGTTVDLTAQNFDPVLDTKFDTTTAFVWLTNNAYKYGFVLSYPKNNAYYQYEPWHWRFVGVALATKLHNENKYFYDLDQRDINIYLANIFDPIAQ